MENITTEDLDNSLKEVRHKEDLFLKLKRAYCKQNCPFKKDQIVRICRSVSTNAFVGRFLRINSVSLTYNEVLTKWNIQGIVLNADMSDMKHPVAKNQLVSCVEGKEKDWFI